LLFHIEHLPGTINAERISYLLGHGNELGTALVALMAGDAYLMKARTDVLEALLPASKVPTPDIAVLQLLLQRVLGVDLAHTHTVASLHDALQEVQMAAAVFCLNPVTLAQVQHAALHEQPLPPDTFRLACAPPRSLMSRFPFTAGVAADTI
jgi:hypothetical protein